MRLRHYLRGLGIGVAVTAVIMGISTGGKSEAMTDAQIIARAKELGMVDGVLAELPETGEAQQPESETQQVPDTAAEPEYVEGPEETAAESSEVAAEPESVQESGESAEEEGGEDEDPQEAAEPVQEERQPETERVATVTVAVYPGEGSHTVSRKLAALGLVESADIYDNYLCQNGYDKKLCAGNYVIPEGAGAEEIARILTESN